MNQEIKNKDFLFLLGDAIPPIEDGTTSEDTRKWIRSRTPEQKRRYRIGRRTAYQLLKLPPRFGLGIRQYAQEVATDNAKIEELAVHSSLMAAQSYGIKGAEQDVLARVGQFAESSNSLMNHLTQKVLTDPLVSFEEANEVTAADNPAELLLILLDPDYAGKLRFEALRKLGWMKLSAANERKRVYNNPRGQFKGFLDFLDDHFFSKKYNIGHTEDAYILTTHDMSDYRCIDKTILDEETAKSTTLAPNQRITVMSRRTFTTFRNNGKPGKDKKVYMPMREKDNISQMLKETRKRIENPDEAFEDEVGVMIIVEQYPDLKDVDQGITHGGNEIGSAVINEEISDSLDGERTDGHIGSSEQVHMLKSPVRVAGARAEVISMTMTDYIDYLYRDGVAHDEYEVNRFFDSGSMELLFPAKIYHYNPSELKERITTAMRRKKRIEMSLYEVDKEETDLQIQTDTTTPPNVSLFSRALHRIRSLGQRSA